MSTNTKLAEALKDAIEGECNGLAITNEQAKAVLAHLAAHDAAQAAQAVPAGFVLVPVEFIEAGQRVAQEYARTNPKWPMWDNGEAEPKVQDPCGVHAWLEQAAMLAAAPAAPEAQDSARTSPVHQPVHQPAHGWTDADADAARLALELECLLTDRDVPMPVTSRWWESAHEALALHRQRLESERAAAPQAAQPEPFPDTEAVTACWQDFGRTEDFRRAVKWSQDGEIPGALFVAFRAGLRAASPKARCDCGKKAAADCEKWEPGCDLGNSPEHARVVRIDLKPEQAQQSELASILARLEAVPVAWPSAADIADEIDALLPMSHGDSTMAAIEEWWRQLVKRKLSKIAPPAAEPLTDEQIMLLGQRAMGKCFGTDAQHVYIAREVERAHGIDASGGEVQK